MKNSAATIGVIPLAGMAKVLEDAARNGEVETLERVTPVFLTIWRSYKEKMALFIKSDANDSSKKNAVEYLSEINDLIAQIRVAAESMDIDGLGGVIQKVANVLPFYHGVSLAKLPFAENTDRMLEHLIWTVSFGLVVYVLSVIVFQLKMKQDVK